MSTSLQDSPSRTRIVFDLRDILTPAELNQFEEAAKEADAPTLTEHFLNLTLRPVFNPKAGKPVH